MFGHDCDHGDQDKFNQIIRGLFTVLQEVCDLRHHVHNLERKIDMATSATSTQLDDLKSQVAATLSTEQSALTVIQTLSANLDAAIAASKAGDDGAALEDLSTQLKGSASGLAAAIAAVPAADLDTSGGVLTHPTNGDPVDGTTTQGGGTVTQPGGGTVTQPGAGTGSTGTGTSTGGTTPAPTPAPAPAPTGTDGDTGGAPADDNNTTGSAPADGQ